MKPYSGTSTISRGGSRCLNGPEDTELGWRSVVEMWPDRGQNVAMQSVNVASLKNNLSRYLAAVKNGKEIVVTSHRHPIARIVPAEKRREDVAIIPARRPVSSLKKVQGIKLDVDLVAELLADRRRR